MLSTKPSPEGESRTAPRFQLSTSGLCLSVYKFFSFSLVLSFCALLSAVFFFRFPDTPEIRKDGFRWTEGRESKGGELFSVLSCPVSSCRGPFVSGQTGTAVNIFLLIFTTSAEKRDNLDPSVRFRTRELRGYTRKKFFSSFPFGTEG